ncbi:extracellular solute-binding protein [Bacillus taeanensis]|uniref:extracellular solute-binding protein n=1 Tax=Bacillus taeanensis TaxID=273032 RepID=UPI001FEA1D25|nr:extracellular solute-binding protein [Bacillus taeanensis]
MLKKLLTFVLLLAFVLLAACGGKTATETSSESGESSGEKKKLTFWHIETGSNQEVLNAAVERFEKNHPDVEVEVIQQENDPYKTKLSVAMGGGTPPDVFTSWGGGWLKEFVKAGQVKDLTEELDKENFVPVALTNSTFDEKLYGAPLRIAFVPVWYNKEIFEKLNLSTPETYEELLGVIETLKDNNIIPFALANQSKWPGAFYLMYFADRIGGSSLFNEAYERTGRAFDNEAYIKAGEKIQELVKAEAFPKGFNGLNYDTGQSRQLFYSGKAGMIIQGTWLLSNIRNELPEFEEKIDIFPFPAVEGGKGSKNNVVGGVNPTFSVSTKSENPDLAVELVKELTSQETAQELTDKSGAIPAVNGVEITDEFAKRTYELLEKSEVLQPYYDQTLPPELAELHKDTTQAIFGLSMTPEEAAKKMEEKAQEILTEK